MAFINGKIPQSDLDTKGIANIRENQVYGQAGWIKGKFDELARLIIPKLNLLIDNLTDGSAADHLGVNISGITAKTIAGVLTIFKEYIDNRYTKDETNKLLNALTGVSFTDVRFNEQSGELTLIKSDGTEFVIDLALYQGGFTIKLDHQTQEMIFTFADGRQERIDLQRFLVPEEFVDTDTIEWTITATKDG